MKYKKKNFLALGIAAFLFIALIAVIFMLRGSRGVQAEAKTQVKDIVCISENGLYASKNTNISPGIYDTSYAARILNMNGEELSKKTEEYFLKQENVFADAEILSDLQKIYLLSWIVPEAVTEEEINSLIENADNQTGYLCSFLTGMEFGESEKIKETWMAVEILENCGKELPEEISQELVKNFGALLQQETDINHMFYEIEILKRLDAAEEIDGQKKKIEKVCSASIQNFTASEELNEELLEEMYQVCCIYKLIDPEELSSEEKQDIREMCVGLLKDGALDYDYQCLYESLVIADFLEDASGVMELKIEEIKEKELLEGGYSNVTYIGTAKESMMVNLLTQVYEIEDMKNIKSNINEYFNQRIEEGQGDIDEIYSCAADIKLSGGSLTEEQQNACLKIGRDYLGVEMTDDNFRMWFYAVKLLVCLDYDFKSSDLPVNTEELIKQIKSGADNALESLDVNTLMYDAIMLDALASIDKSVVDEELIEILNKAAQMSVDKPYWFKVRYYAILALDNLECCSQELIHKAIEESAVLTHGEVVQADETTAQGDLQSTFQRSLLILMDNGEEMNYVR